MNKDIISKEILKELIKDISNYILHLEINEIVFLDTSNQRVEERRSDIVASIDNKFILHIEIQNNNDLNMPIRMLRYYTDIKMVSNLPVKQFVIYIGKNRVTIKNTINEENINYQYTLIDMKKIDCEYFISK